MLGGSGPDSSRTPARRPGIGSVEFASGRKTSVGHLEFRVVRAGIALFDEAPDAETLAQLLEFNAGLKIGQISLIQCGDKYLVLLRIQIPADADAEYLELAVRAVARVADHFEKS